MYKVMIRPSWHKRFAEQKPAIRYHTYEEALARARYHSKTAFIVKIMAENSVFGTWYELKALHNHSNAGNGPAPEKPVPRTEEEHRAATLAEIASSRKHAGLPKEYIP